MTPALNLRRWTAAALVASALLFAMALVMERAGEGAEGISETAQEEAVEQAEGSRDEALEPDEATGEAEEAAAAHGEANEAGEAELLFGINLENPVLTWGFVAASVIVAAWVWCGGGPALVLAIVLAGGAALLDLREVSSQVSSPPVAMLAGLTALAHIAVVVLAVMTWRANQKSVTMER